MDARKAALATSGHEIGDLGSRLPYAIVAVSESIF
jgi:hypothetical protein